MLSKRIALFSALVIFLVAMLVAVAYGYLRMQQKERAAGVGTS